MQFPVLNPRVKTHATWWLSRSAQLIILFALSVQWVQAQSFEEVVRQHPSILNKDAEVIMSLGNKAVAAPPIATPTPLPNRFDLLQDQTPADDQLGYGSCQTYAFLGALEAFYNRRGNQLDLSEQYFVHIVHSSIYPGDAGIQNNGEIRSVMEGLMIPEEVYAPTISTTDYDAIGVEHGYFIRNSNNQVQKNEAVTQAQLDAFHYDQRIIPLQARRKAIYGPTELVAIDNKSAKDTEFLTRIIASGREISIGMSWWQVDCGPDDKSDPKFVFDDGNYKCFDHIVGVNDNPAANHGHQVLLIGYDLSSQYFLAKNSYGTSFDFVWLPFSLIEATAESAYFIWSVRDPSLGPSLEAFWIGPWWIETEDRKSTAELVIRRSYQYSVPQIYPGMTRIIRESGEQTAVLGSYIQDGKSYLMTGRIQGDEVSFSVDFSKQDESLPPVGTVVQELGERFKYKLVSTADGESIYGICAIGGQEKEDEYKHQTYLVRPELSSSCARPRPFAWLGSSLSLMR